LPRDQPRNHAERGKWHTIRLTLLILGGVLIVSLFLGKTLHQKYSRERVIAMLDEINSKTILTELPKLKQAIDSEKQKVDRLASSADRQQAVDYYIYHQEEINVIFRLYRKMIEKCLDLKEAGKSTKEVDEITSSSQENLAKMIQKYRLPALEIELLQQPPKFGFIKRNKKPSDQEKQFEEGALKTTYEILMTDNGVGADFNQDGILDTKESAQIPCETLEEIRILWKKCTWYSSDSNNPHTDLECGKLNLSPDNIDASTLASFISLNNPDDIVNRVKSCERYNKRQ
jgi:hypothetical protein